MGKIRKNRFRLGCLTATCLVLLGIGLWLGQQWISARTTPSTPKIVDVIVMAGPSRQTIQLRDPTAIVVLQSLIDDGETVSARPPSRAEFEIFVHPTGRPSYKYSPTPVWQLDDGSFAWYHDGRITKLDGSFTDFIAWLKIRRINQLLRNPDPAQRQLGEQLREASGQAHSEALVRIANSTNGWFAQAGIREMADFISLEPANLNLYVPGELQRPGRTAVADPDRRIRDALLDVVKRSPQTKHTDDPFGAGAMALTSLQQVGDRSTADALVTLFDQHQDGRLGGQLLTTIELLYGIPVTLERFGICGNSTAEELAAAQREAVRRQTAAMKDLLAWQKDHAGDSDQEFYDAVVLRWSEMLIHLATTPDPNSYQSDRTPAPQLTNLLGLGAPVVPALKRRQTLAADWHEVAMLEFCVAFLTGQCDAKLVTELLDGEVAQQHLACSIIAAAADGTWDDRVAALLRTPLPGSKVEEVVLLRDVAAQALYRTRGVKALPIFRSALSGGFESQMILQILDRFEVPVTEF